MHIYEQLVEPTVVTHSLLCKLDPNQAHTNLIIARGASLLQVYSLHRAPEDYTIPNSIGNLLSASNFLPQAPQNDRLFLKFVSQWPFDGHLIGLDTIQKEGKTLLLMAFKHAKITIVEWIPQKGIFKPISLHCYEKDILEANFKDLNFPAQLFVEPNSQCLSMLFQRDTLSLLSFPDQELFEGMPSRSSILTSSNLEPQCRNIIHLAYIAGYNEPTIGVLYQSPPTWTGSLPLNKDTTCFHIVSVDIERQSSTTIIAVDNLPYDISQVIPLGAPLHGCLLVGSNVLLYVESSGRTISCAVNEWAQRTSSSPLIDMSHLDIDLANSKVVHILDTPHCIVVTSSGHTYTLNFAVDGLKVFGISLEKYDQCPILPNPTTISVSAAAKSIFIAANASPVLLTYALERELVEATAHEDEPDEFDEVYTQDLGPSKLVLSMSDALLSLGPITSVTNIDGETFDDPSTLCVAFGRDHAAGVASFQKGLWPRKSYSLDKFSRLWATNAYVVGTSSSQLKSFIYNARTLETIIASGFKTDVFTLAFGQTSKGYIHIHSGGLLIYDFKLKVQKTLEFDAKARSAKISGNNALVCREDNHDLTLYRTFGASIRAEEVIGQSNRYNIHDEHIVIANGSDVAFTNVHEPLQQETYSFKNLADNVNDAEAFTETDNELTADISNIEVCEIGDRYAKELVLVIVIENLLTIYDFKTRCRIYTAPSTADLDIHSFVLGDLSVIAAGGTTPFVLMKSHKVPIRFRPIRTRRALSIGGTGEDILFVNSRKMVERITFSPHFDLTTLDWPVFTSHVGETISSLAYNDTAAVLILATNTPHERAASTEDVKMEDEGDEPQEPQERKPPRCNIYKSFLKVMNPETLHITDTVALGAEEAVMCVKSVKLEVAENTNHFKEFLAVGTSLLLDEDSVSNGYFYLYTITDIVPDKERPEVRHKVKEVFKELCAGAVTSVCEVMGKLAVAQGQRLLMRGVQEDHTIEPIAFCDLEVFVSDLKSIRNLILAGDLYKSTWLVNFGNEPNRLDVLSKDNEASEGVIATEALSSEIHEDLHIVSSDRDGRLKILQFDPDNVLSMGGPNLVLQSHLYIGCVVNTMLLAYGKHKDVGAIGGTSYGGLISVMPVNDDDYRALFVITQEIMDKEQPFACLNTRAHLNMNCLPTNTLAIYGPCAQKFWGLSRSKQLAFSRKLGRRGLDDIFTALTEEPLDYF